VIVDEDVEAWAVGLDDLFALVAGRFLRAEPRRRARAYVRGLLAPLAGKNGRTLAEVAGDAMPDGMQRLLNAASWDADGVGDDVRAYAARHLGERDGALIVDETGFLKKGAKCAGVQRQYSGTAGGVENCQLGVFLADASGRGRTLIDRELHLPKSWIADRGRVQSPQQGAGVGDERDEGRVRKAGKNWTVEKWLNHWLYEIVAPPTITENAWEAYEVACRVHLMPGVGAHRLQRSHADHKLEPEHLEKLYRKPRGTGLGSEGGGAGLRAARRRRDSAYPRDRQSRSQQRAVGDRARTGAPAGRSPGHPVA
jgi:hypothetical protein